MDAAKNDIVQSEEAVPKIPFKRLKYPLSQVVGVAIPLHIQCLNEQSEIIGNLKKQNHPLQLRSKQVEASKSVQLLKADLFELEQLHQKVRDEDSELFHDMVRTSLGEAADALTTFMLLHSDILGPIIDIDDTSVTEIELTPVICDLSRESQDDVQDCPTAPEVLATQQISKSTPSGWTFLRKELLEIHSLIQKFSSLVFSQQESIDSIQSNVLQTQENVHAGTLSLKKASLIRGATFPIAGAVIGGALLGPVGALVGFKLLGSVAFVAGGSALGYKCGKKIKEKQESICNIEMKALTYPKSSSNPELTVDSKSDKEA